MDMVSGGYLYNRRLRDYLLEAGHNVCIRSLKGHSYTQLLMQNFNPLSTIDKSTDVFIVDAIAHPAVLLPINVTNQPWIALQHMVHSHIATGPSKRLKETIERYFLQSVDGAIHTSSHTADHAGRLGFENQEVVAMPGGDHLTSPNTQCTPRRRLEQEPLRLLFVGNVVYRKGLDILIRALARLDKEWTLRIVGQTDIEPSYVDTLRLSIKKNHLQDDIDLTGFVPDSTLKEHLQWGDVLLLPSRYEPFGIAALEGMSFGCVPVVSNRGGAADFIENETSGFLVEPTEKSLLAAIEQLFIPDQHHRMSEMAIQSIDHHPTWNESMGQIESFLHTMNHHT